MNKLQLLSGTLYKLVRHWEYIVFWLFILCVENRIPCKRTSLKDVYFSRGNKAMLQLPLFLVESLYHFCWLMIPTGASWDSTKDGLMYYEAMNPDPSFSPHTKSHGFHMPEFRGLQLWVLFFNDIHLNNPALLISG